MARGRKKGKQSAGAFGKAERYGAWLRQLAEAKWELKKRNAATTGALAATGSTRSNVKWKRGPLQQPQRYNGRAAARFLEQYLRGPPLPSAHALTDPAKARGAVAGAAEEEGDGEEIDLEAWLVRERRRRQREKRPSTESAASEAAVAVESESVIPEMEGLSVGEEEIEDDEEEDGDTEGGIPSLTTLCCLQVGQDLPLYGAAAANTGAGPTADNDEGDDATAAAEAIRALFHLLPNDCLERISLAASEEGAVDDAGLALLCQPSVTRLVLVGTCTEAGLARALYPRLQTAVSGSSTSTTSNSTTSSGSGSGSAPGVSWEDEAFEPHLEGCVALESLLLSSPALGPATLLPSLGRHLPTLRTLALPQCFNARVTTTCREVLSGVSAAFPYVHELDLRGCNWLSDKGLLGWVMREGRGSNSRSSSSGGGGGVGRGAQPIKQQQLHQQQQQRGAQGPPPALRRLMVDARIAQQEELRGVFAAYRPRPSRGGGGGVGMGMEGGGKEKGAGGIALVGWADVEKGFRVVG